MTQSSCWEMTVQQPFVISLPRWWDATGLSSCLYQLACDKTGFIMLFASSNRTYWVLSEDLTRTIMVCWDRWGRRTRNGVFAGRGRDFGLRKVVELLTHEFHLCVFCHLQAVGFSCLVSELEGKQLEIGRAGTGLSGGDIWAEAWWQVVWN